ncbi:LysR family transcriptional regulator [Streptomyces albidoflavus]|nr:LysR family transcriptional regulator [Streptomyces albidoflavus]MCU7703657.1 LysR family transcriptional regulator [Streptomyces albidoflavus]
MFSIPPIEECDSTMEIKHLWTFLAVAKHLNFTRAAGELSFVQSSVTSHVQALEAELGVRLFDRLGRRTVLTDAGRELRGRAPDLLSHIEQTRDAVREAGNAPGDARGTLRVAAPESLCAYWLPEVLRAFQDRYPRVRVTFGAAARGPLLEALTEGAVDLGFLLEESVEAAGVHAVRMAEERLCLVTRPGHGLAGREAVRTADLSDETMLLIEPSCAQRALVERELRTAGVAPIAMEFVSIEALKRCAAAGLGVAVVPSGTVLDEVARGTLTVLPWTRELELGVFAVHHRNRRPTRMLQELLALAREHWAAGAADRRP